MPLAADYLVFSDRLRSLERGEDIDVSYQRELDVTPAEAPQILAYKAASNGRVTYRVSLNGRETEVHEFLERENWRTLHEVLPSGSLKQGLNTLTVRILERGEEQLLVQRLRGLVQEGGLTASSISIATGFVRRCLPGPCHPVQGVGRIPRPFQKGGVHGQSRLRRRQVRVDRVETRFGSNVTEQGTTS